MFIIRKKFKFEMAHQLKQAYSDACSSTIHGHSYICEVYFKSELLDETGMVIDFGCIKDKIKSYMDSWDHALVMPSGLDKEYIDVLKKYNRNLNIVKYNPTAENMAKDIYKSIKRRINITNIEIHKVRLHETTTGWAEYYEE